MYKKIRKMAFPLIPVIGLGLQALGMIQSASATNRAEGQSMALAKWQLDAQRQLIADQNAYNDPRAQMARYQAAGLNPHLIYGQGSSGNQPSSGSAPQPSQVDYHRQMNFAQIAQALPIYNQTRLADAQVQAIDAKTRRENILAELNQVQKSVLEKNPVLDPSALEAIISSLKSAAEIKASQAETSRLSANWFTGKASLQDVADAPGLQKLEAELNLIDQRFGLSKIDAEIKGQILESKEFQNAILEVQKKFMTDGEITPQHLLQFAQLLMMKLF